ncbi:MAG: leucine-rich repeat protein, partial [Oscillospiraceae bacterium]|nr:leucine-rich repeat protein [Oscillospiraceae bacterium]
MKRTISFLLALCLVLGTLPIADAASDLVSGSCGPNATYTLANGVLTISGSGPVNTRPWYNRYFSLDMSHTITQLVIQEGITALTSRAFDHCERLSQVEIADSVTHIGVYCFDNTPWLAAQTDDFVVVGDGVLLSYNGPDGAVTIPENVLSIAGGAFQGCAITSVTIGGHVKEVGDSAFADCERLGQVTIADTVGHFGASVFAGTPWLAAQTDDFVIVGDGVLVAYQGPGGTVTIPDNVRVISQHTFFKTEGISGVTIPATVVEIGTNAFQGGYISDGRQIRPVLTVHGALGSAAQTYTQTESAGEQYRFVPFGQEDGSLFNFIVTKGYFDTLFEDVERNSWYSAAVETVYSRGLMKGMSDVTFAPYGTFTLAETVTVAARVHDIYYYKQTDFSGGEPWYRTYADYAMDHGIMSQHYSDYSAPVTRAEFAKLLCAALPEDAFPPTQSSIIFSDVPTESHTYPSIMKLAQAGILGGRGEGKFEPDATITRAEVAAVLARIVKPSLRLSVCTGSAADGPQSLPIRENPVAAGLEDCYAIRADGSLVMWGRLETGADDAIIPFERAAVLMDNAAAVYTDGRSGVLAVDQNGTLWSVNSARFNEVIPGFTFDQERPLAPLKVMDDVAMAAMVQFHSVILKRDGSVWVQGFVSFGAHWLKGQGPYLVQVMDGAVEVGVTAYGGWAVTADQELWAWGLTPDKDAKPEKLMSGVAEAGDIGETFTALTQDGRLNRWVGDGGTAPDFLLDEVSICGPSWAIRTDGSLWADKVGYGSVSEDGPLAYI